MIAVGLFLAGILWDRAIGERIATDMQTIVESGTRYLAHWERAVREYYARGEQPPPSYWARQDCDEWNSLSKRYASWISEDRERDESGMPMLEEESLSRAESIKVAFRHGYLIGRWRMRRRG